MHKYNTFNLKPFIVISGFSRSGTSFLARTLNLCGVHLGNLESLISHDLEPDEYNPHGNWENKNFKKLSNKTWALNNMSLENIPAKIKLNEEIKHELETCVNELMNTPALAVGFKEPTSILLLDIWYDFFPQNSVLVAIFRNPLIVSESLVKTRNFTYETSLKWWQNHNEKLLEILTKHKGFLLNFDWPKERLLDEIQNIVKKLDLMDYDISKTYSSEFKTSDKKYQKNYSLPKSVIDVYDKLLKRSEKNHQINIEQPNRSKEELKSIIKNQAIDMNQRSEFLKMKINTLQKLTTVSSNSKSIVTELYKEVLCRNPDYEGLLHFSYSLDNKQITVNDIRNDLLSSEEYKNKN